MKKTSIAFVVAGALFCASSFADTPEKNALDKQYKADLAQSKATYNSAMKACKPMKGADQTACEKQAKADRAKTDASVKDKYKQDVATLKQQQKKS